MLKVAISSIVFRNFQVFRFSGFLFSACQAAFSPYNVRNITGASLPGQTTGEKR